MQQLIGDGCTALRRILNAGCLLQSKLPRHAVLKDALLEWRKLTPYKRPDDYVFASHRLRGKKPIDLKEVFVKKIKPAVEELGLVPSGAV